MVTLKRPKNTKSPGNIQIFVILQDQYIDYKIALRFECISVR